MLALLDPAGSPTDTLPPPECAMAEPNGLLAAGGALTLPWLLAAYKKGIFPWYGQGEPILWWSPTPRMVLATAQFKLRKSLLKRLRQMARTGIQIRANTAFDAVISACAAPRPGPGGGTWIMPAIIDGYNALHQAGYAQSIEVWRGETLVGGLYGVSIGQMFYGESMFMREADVSKAALAVLVQQLRDWQCPWIDCQQQTHHLASMGAQPIARADFLRGIAHLSAQPALPWQQLAGTDLLATGLSRMVST